MDVITLKNISKKYYLNKERPLLFKSIFQARKKEEVWALRNVSLKIKKGETLGIIGANGSGKSTLLKVLAGITTPTKGSVKVEGRVGSLIELGAGFQTDLTGRENLYVNGALLGFSKKDLDEKYDKIVAFADIGEYIDQPVRTYSSGMVVRLGFSVAIHLDPDILLIDEVLAVGDLRFQQKCFVALENIKNKGKTVVFVSHNLEDVVRLSKKTVFLKDGQVSKRGNPKAAISAYFRIVKKAGPLSNGYSLIKGSTIAKVELLNVSTRHSIKFNQVLGIRVFVNYTSEVQTSFLGYIITDEFGRIVSATNTFAENAVFNAKKKGDKLIVDFLQRVPFRQGKYFVQVHLFPEPHKLVYFDILDNAAEFVVETDQLIFTSVHIKPKIVVKAVKK